MMNRMYKWLSNLRNRHFLLIDSIVFLIAPLLALFIRLDGSVEIERYQLGLTIVTILFSVIKLTELTIFGFYKHYWLYASIDELMQISLFAFIAMVTQTLVFEGLYLLTHVPIHSLPRSLPILDALLSFLIIGGFRFSVRAIDRATQHHRTCHMGYRVLVVGAGSAGVSLVQEMQRNPLLGLHPVAFVDDDTRKRNLSILGIKVLGDCSMIPAIVHSMRIRRIIIAMPTASGSTIREIVKICQETGVRTSILPAIYELLNSRLGIENIRDIRIEDLLRREPIQTDPQQVAQLLQGKRVLITGAGGSIGSELCRQILKFRPAEIVLLGKGENSVFTIQQELEQCLQSLEKEAKPHELTPKITIFVTDIRSLERLQYAFEQFKPEIIFHAAAHKHVPLMELNSPEAITNNVLGTRNLLEMAKRYDVEQFVMISTDKAVNPTSIMGASKRVAEMLVLQAAKMSQKPFVVVRFGNVLGSRGSVVPTFKRQIAAGGPVTVTHPDMRRYFMTIPEAVQLVLQASVIGHGGEVLMLDMGKPVKILDLAKDMIRLSGYEVGKDINITFTGLRPGEKLVEELFLPGEQYEPTHHPKIIIVRNAKTNIPDHLAASVVALCQAAYGNNATLIRSLLSRLVTGYIPDGEPEKVPQPRSEITRKVSIERPKAIAWDRQLDAVNNKPSHAATLPYERLEHDLKQAIEHQDLRLYYQPIMNLETVDVVGFEAVLRWQHPEFGFIPSVKFIPVAEKAGLMVPLTLWLLREICQQSHIWQEQFPCQKSVTMSVSLYSRQLLQPSLLKQLSQILHETHVDTCNLRLGIPASILWENSDFEIAVLHHLRDLHLRLQIDNVGIAHASIDPLRRLSSRFYKMFDCLKINGSVIHQIDTDKTSLDFLQTVIETASQLGLEIVAGGIETSRQLALLRSLQCKYGQGFFFSKPVGYEAAKQLINV
jgi:FlaA1/EpsC-like NDP-sugar epimerase/EAL domain-containing protein (putative c-di-GMP-specific phosphodiesterase class I)